MKFNDLPEPIVIDTLRKARELSDILQNSNIPYAVDTETNGLSVKNKISPCNLDSINCWSLSDGIDRYYIEAEYLKEFDKSLFNNSNIIKIFHNLKYDRHCLENEGILLTHPYVDTMIGHWLFDERKFHRLDACAKELLDMGKTSYNKVFNKKEREVLDADIDEDELFNEDGSPDIYAEDIEEVINKKFNRPQKPDTSLIKTPKMVEYATLDAYLTAKLFFILKEKLEAIPWIPTVKEEFQYKYENKTLWDYYWEIERQFTDVLYKMERNGIWVDEEYLRVIEKNCLAEMRTIETYFNTLTGEVINLNSPDQLAKLFYEKLKLPVLGMTKGGKSGNKKPTTDAKVLEKLYAKNPEMIGKILRYRSIAKTKSTYAAGIAYSIKWSEDGKLHPSLNQANTVSGRLSGSNPNTQNMPRPDGDEFKIRNCFRPEPGKQFIISDLSQAEIRLIAHLAGCTRLVEDLKTKDIYKAVYSSMFSMSIDDVSSAQRKLAKVIVLGTNYCMGPKTLSLKIESDIGWENTPYGKVSPKERVEICKALLATYFAQYPELANYIKYTPILARQKQPMPYLRTLLGRYRRMPELMGLEKWSVAAAEREIVNVGPQGGVADLLRGTMIKIDADERLKELGCKLLLQIHDEIVVECPNENVEMAMPIIEHYMTHPWDDLGIELILPLETEIHASDRWTK
jgi:DNA polymerase I-like protein with 3'-5' exonuclease and polymerase domains